MTFQQLADKLILHILDLIPDEEEAENLKDQELFNCFFTDSLIADGILNKDLSFNESYT